MIEMHAHYGLARAPFTKNLTTEMLHHHHGHDEAAARITYCIREGAIAVITGEADAGKTAAARAAAGGIDRTRHHVIYIPNPTTGTRGLWHAIVVATGGKPALHDAPSPPRSATPWPPRPKNTDAVLSLLSTRPISSRSPTSRPCA